jgi:adenosylcobinamide-GDP ribazoletransferase
MRVIIKNKYVIDFFATVMFFTRIPIKWSFFSDKPPNLTKAAWAFPLVGLLTGVLSGVLGDFLIFLGLPIFLCCIIAITLSVILTGAFHEDGLADTADGLGAGGSPERINEIIHDSRLGTYGVVALILGLLTRLGLLLTLFEYSYSLVSILSVGFASGKLAIIFSRNFFNNSRFVKMGSVVGTISNKNLFIATVIWALPTLIIFPFYGILLGGILMAFIIFILGLKSKKALGGISGDILGAIAFLTELVFLLGIIVVTVTVN